MAEVNYDVIVIGGGTAGLRAARTANSRGLRVALAGKIFVRTIAALPRIYPSLSTAVQAAAVDAVKKM